MARIKICGLRREADIDFVNKYLPDYVGFVFAPSRRQVTKEQAKVLRQRLKPEIVPVGVFVNAPAEDVAALVNEGVIDMVQLHGEESEEYIQKLKELTGGATIIKAVRVATEADVRNSLDTKADYLLFDTYSAEVHGGTGQTFDWSLIRGVEKHFFLAGGITAENVAEAIEAVQPYAVDVSSAVETEGFKDQEKIYEMITRVRESDLFK